MKIKRKTYEKIKNALGVAAFGVAAIALFVAILSKSDLPDGDCELPELPRPSTYLQYEDASNYEGLIAEETEVAVTTTVEDEHAVYYLTPQERAEVERTVMAEAGGESKLGQMAVAQCILNACHKSGIRPIEVLKEYKYTKNRMEASAEVKAAVSAVFDDGEVAVAENILYFYAFERVSGDGHEARHDYVCTIGGHKFFKDKAVE